MNEDQNLQELFHRIESGVSASVDLRKAASRHIASPKRPTVKLRLAMAGGLAAAVCVALGIVVLLPSASAAGAYRRIEAAISDAKYMHVRSFGEYPGKPPKLLSELFYSNGAWRMDAFPGTRLARTFLRVGDDQWLYQENTDVAVKEPFTGGFLADRQSAFEFAESMSDEGRVGLPRDFSIEQRPDEDNRAVYGVIATRKDTPYHLEMIVDKKTNLPIRTTFSGEDPNSQNYRIIIADYTFGDRIDPKAFSPQIKPTTKLLNMGTEAEAAKSAWRVPIKSIRKGGTYVDVRDIAVNQQGEVFITCSFGPSGNSENKWPYPKNLLPDSLQDDQGRSYLLIDTLTPGGLFGDTQARDYFKFGSDSVAITEWAPLQPTTAWVPASSLDISFVLRTWTGYPTYRDPSIQSTEEFRLTKPIPGHFPPYSSGMLLDDVHQQFEMIASEQRAELCEKQSKFAQAARWYRDAAKEAWPLENSKTYEQKAARCQKKVDDSPVP